jgi:DNA-binding transcriptional LysR family regulator
LTPALFNAEGHVDVHLVLGKAGTGHRAAEDAFARYDLVRRVAITVPTFAAAAMVVAATDLLAGMPRRVAATLARSLPLNILKPPMPALRFPMLLLWHERTERDPACVYFRDLVARALAASAR